MKNKLHTRALTLILVLSLCIVPSFAFEGTETPASNYSVSIVNQGYDQPEHSSEGPPVPYTFGEADKFPSLSRASTLIFDRYVSAYYPLQFRERAFQTSRTTARQQFVKYLTSNWQKANGYTWTQSVTVNWSVSGEANVDVADDVRVALGLSAFYEASTSVGAHIPANSAKLSKLALKADFTVVNFRLEGYERNVETQAERVTYTHQGEIKTPTGDTYLVVAYQ